MSRYERRRRLAPVVYLFTLLLALPPGWFPAAFAVANRRLNTLERDTKLETFRNPQFSTAGSNRFLGTLGPRALVGSGGDDFSNPDSRGYGAVAEPQAHWISYKGRLEWTVNDLMLPGVGLPLIFQRIWRGSVSSYDGPLGKEWEFNWNKRLNYDASGSPTRVWFHELGRREDYVLSGGAYTSPIGRYDTLTRTATPEYWRTDREGVKEVYEQEAADGTWFRLKSITDLNGNALAFAYDASSLLTKVTDTLAQDTTLAWDANDRITKITDHASREWVYGYDGSGRLTSVRTPVVDEDGSAHDFTSGKTTTYKYDTAGQLTEIKRPEDSGTGTWVWAYDTDGRITKETRSGNDIGLTFDDANKKVTVTDRESNKVVYWYDDGHEGNLITKRQQYYDASNYHETTYGYDAAGNVLSVIFPKGNRVHYTFDGSGNVVSVQFKKDGADGTPKTWVYSWAANARLSTLQDPNGNVWDHDYDTAGNLTRKAAPAVTLPTGIASTDKNGNGNNDGTIVETWAYNASGQVTRHTDPVGTHTDTTYTTVNSKSAYPQHVIRGSGGLNLTTQYAYDGKGNVTSVTDPNGNATTYKVNALNQVWRAIEPLSVTRDTYYDANDRVTKTEASNDTDVGNSLFTVVLAYDQQDNLVTRTEDLGSGTTIATVYAYDKSDRVTKVTSPEGNQTVTSYDSRDLVTGVTRKAASAPDDIITASVYDANGNRVTSTDGRGYHTITAYDGYDRVTRVTQPEGNYTTSEYDAAGNVLTSQRYNASNTKLAETVHWYDQANRLYQTEQLAKKADLSTNIGDGWQTKTIWRDERGAVLEHSGDVCGCANYVHVYDAVGRQITSKDPMGATDGTRNLVLSEYDKNGNVTKTTRKERSQDTGIEADKDIVTEMVYDARNRRTTLKERLDGSTTMDTVYSYGKRDQVTKVVDGNGDERRTEYNEQLWKTKEIAENGATDPTTEYVYDDDGNLLTYRAKNATTGDQDTVYTYDVFDRVITTQWPPNPLSAEVTAQTYDKAGNRISTSDPMDTVVVCAYDKNNRLTSRSITLGPGVLGATSHSFGYDGANRMISADTNEGVGWSSALDWTYNTLGKVETEKQVLDGYNSGNGRTITYTYDVEGNKTSTTYPVSGDVISVSRDALDRVDKISRGSSELVDYTFSGSRVIKTAYPGSHTTTLYDGYGRVTDIHHKDTSSGNSLGRNQYWHDKSHQITAWDRYYYDDVQNTRITTNGAFNLGAQFKYDGAKRLITALQGVATANITTALATNLANSAYTRFQDYRYDQTGNRTTRQEGGVSQETYVHDKANQISTENGSAVAHDATGNYTGGGTTAFAYTWNNQLARYINSSGSPAVTHTWHYDALGRKVQWEETATSRTYRYYHDGDDTVEHVQWNGSVESVRKQYVFGDHIDDVVLYTEQVSNPDKDYFAHKDHLGSVQVLVDGNGAIKEGYRYLEWGQTTIVDDTFAAVSGTESATKNNVRFAGRDQYTAFGSETNTYYNNRARVYRTSWGRFGQRDHLSPNEAAYLYCNARPLYLLDPSGDRPVNPASVIKVQMLFLLMQCCLEGVQECCDYVPKVPFCCSIPYTAPEAVKAKAMHPKVDDCCCDHDKCYAEAGSDGLKTIDEKNACDDAFTLCLNESGAFTEEEKWIIDMYSFGVRWGGGWGHFWDGGSEGGVEGETGKK